MSIKDKQITSRPANAAAVLAKERGVWVLRVGEALSVSATEELIREARDERDLKNPGKGDI